jgi:cyclopropane fatty-acyl-phospholipid synthase-like methyltransferase
MVKIVEFFNTEQESEKARFDYDLADDIHQFMINDPVFYRRHYFPKVTSMCDKHKKGTEINPASELKTVILNACNQYVETFKLNADPDTLLDEREVEAIAVKIYNIETGR